MREKDPVLGIVTVRLAELFKNSSEVTRLFSLQEGVGKCLVMIRLDFDEYQYLTIVL